jgi:hypothetical protein
VRKRSATERRRREALRAQHAAAHAWAWLRGRCDWPCAARADLVVDQAYVAHLYERARAAVANIAASEHRV